MTLRRIPPVHSPLAFTAVLAPLGASDLRPTLAMALEREYGALRVILTASGTDALTLALQAAERRRPGLPCALPAYGCYDLATAALGAGVCVRLYDIDPATLAAEPGSLARALAGGAAALVVVHHFGVPAPLDAMRAAAHAAGALLIEDAAQGNGGRWDGLPLGSHGDLGVLSFGRGKGETGGGGGALLVRTDAVDHAAIAATLGPASGGAAAAAVKLGAQWLLGRPALYALPSAIPALRLGETVYKAPSELREMPAHAARVLAHTRSESAAEAALRRRNAEHWRGLIGSDARRVGEVPARGEAGWLRAPVLLDLDAARLATGAALGVLRGYPTPLNELAPLLPSLDSSAPMPGASQMARRLHTLPTHRFVGPRDREAIGRWLVAALGRD